MFMQPNLSTLINGDSEASPGASGRTLMSQTFSVRRIETGWDRGPVKASLIESILNLIERKSWKKFSGVTGYSEGNRF